ncbi:HBL230Wp [Eremothecium sinecaudum]|uniref:Peptidyl-prolyl cis-trans isomerase n=1 Tax=Eremothecium sinecaudum TaxID=45286 RepID=A0A109UWL4_9SACH|nr:HBL230Wp [Eremothecium sinecaudum]AMD18672.1 HBL230Wp [Eremothecium sinecaudum]
MTSETGLPAPWTVRFSKTRKREYYFNPETKQSQWELPEGTDSKKLEEYLENNPVKVRCLHLLIKHKGSRRPASHRNSQISITKEEAIEELKKYALKYTEGARFEDLAVERSDCSSYKKGGDLGFFGRGEMQAEFEKVAFSLKVGEVSGIADSDSGVHLIKRVA